MFGFLTQQARDHPDPLLTPKTASGWLRQLPVRTITAYIHPDHHASAGVARSAGLAPTRRRRDGEVRWQLEISGPP